MLQKNHDKNPKLKSIEYMQIVSRFKSVGRLVLIVNVFNYFNTCPTKHYFPQKSTNLLILKEKST